MITCDQDTCEPVRVRRFLGVIGGMGPLATADFLAKLVTLQERATTDQERNTGRDVYVECESTVCVHLIVSMCSDVSYVSSVSVHQHVY